MKTNFVNVAEVKNDIRFLSDYSEDFVYDYSGTDGYICDLFSEFADCRTSIYYSDIIRFISENVELVNDTIAEFGWEGCGADLYKAGQLAEYCMIENELSCDIENIVLSNALIYIQDVLYMEEIPVELWDEIQEWAENSDNNDHFNDICANIDEWLAEQKDDIA